jgi:hypothetical protein
MLGSGILFLAAKNFNMKKTLHRLLIVIKKRWFSFTIVFFAAVFLISATVTLLTPTPPINGDDHWYGNAPGHLLNEAEIEKNLGKKLSQTKAGSLDIHTYSSSYPTIPHEIVTNSENMVVFIKEPLALNLNETIQTYYSQYGEPNLQLYVINDLSLNALVYLEKGIVLITHIESDDVQEKWLFVPTSAQLFMETWGKSLSETPKSNPERLPLE